MKKILLILLFILPDLALASFTGVISQLYADEDGNIAVQLVGGFNPTEVANQCPTYNGWVGSYTSSEIMKTALIVAYSAKRPVVLGVSGCVNSWIKLRSVYLLP